MYIFLYAQFGVEDSDETLSDVDSELATELEEELEDCTNYVSMCSYGYSAYIHQYAHT